MMTSLAKIQQALEQVSSLIDGVDWNMPVEHPDQTRKLVEAKADAMRCRDKLVVVYVMVENPDMSTKQAHQAAQLRFSFSEGASRCSGGCDNLWKAKELVEGHLLWETKN